MNILSVAKSFGEELNNPKLLGQHALYLGKHALYIVGGVLACRKVLLLSGAGFTTAGAKVTDMYNKNGKINNWFHKKSDAYIDMSRKYLVRDLTLAAVVIGAGLSFEAISNFEAMSNKEDLSDKAASNIGLQHYLKDWDWFSDVKIPNKDDVVNASYIVGCLAFLCNPKKMTLLVVKTALISAGATAIVLARLMVVVGASLTHNR